jgi:hypothetical protein
MEQFDFKLQQEASQILGGLLQRYPQLNGLSLVFNWGYGFDASRLATGVTSIQPEGPQVPMVASMLRSMAGYQADLAVSVLEGLIHEQSVELPSTAGNGTETSVDQQGTDVPNS